MLKEKTTVIHQLIQSTMDAVQLNLPLKEDRSGVNMCYNFIGEYVGFDAQRLVKAHEEMNTTISLETYIQTITIHELGHAMDQAALSASLPRTVEIFQMKKRHPVHELYTNPELLASLIEEHEMNLVFEETAWNNAEKLNEHYQIVDPSAFEQIRRHSLSSYYKLYEEDLQLYDKLNASQPA